ncbi:hypothetical protein [Uliginosibacterium gangwonense]|uniref:hypothetical protein n=1 Tax=Uliginosibacterium gangwonense TaxID=392736 RepID=UPI00036111D4|nr:hypothetical protein [Uliginosibacterium gangwonense]
MKRIVLLAFWLLATLVACSQGSSQSIGGTYLHKGNSETIELNADGSCVLHQDGREYRGTFQKQDNTLQLELGISMSLKFNIQDNELIDEKGEHWARKP